MIRVCAVAAPAILRVLPVIPAITTTTASTALPQVSTSSLVLNIAPQELVLVCIATKDAAIVVSIRTELILTAEAGLPIGPLAILSTESRRARPARRTKPARPIGSETG